MRGFSRYFTRDFYRAFGEAIGGIVAYNPTFVLDNMGQINKPTLASTMVNTRTSTATAFDHEGALVTGEAGEIMLDGGRRVENPLTRMGAGWNVSGFSLTQDYQGLGTRIAYLSGIPSHARYDRDTVITGDAQGRTIAVTLKVRATSADCYFRIKNSHAGQGDNYSDNILATSEFETFTFAVTNGAGGDTQRVGIRGPNLVSSVDIIVEDIWISDVTDCINQAPPSYIDSDIDHGYGVNGVKWYSTTNGNSFSSSIVTEAPGTAISPVPQVLMQPQRANLLTYSRDLSNAAWVNQSTPVSALSEVGLDGVANSAVLFTDNAAAYSAKYQVMTVSTIQNTSTFRAFVKKDANTTRFPGIGVHPDGAFEAEVWAFDTSTGAVWHGIDAGTTTSQIEINSVGDWWEVILEASSSGVGTSIRPKLWPSLCSGTISNLEDTATGSIVVGNVEFYENTTIEQVRGTAPIFTEAAAVTVDADELQVSDFDSWFGSTEGVMIFALTAGEDFTGSTQARYISAGGSGDGLLLYRNPTTNGIRSYAGGSTPEALFGNTPGEEIVAGVIWSATLNKLQVGYSQGGATWQWATAGSFASFPLEPKLIFGLILGSAHTQRSTLIYDGLPPGNDATLADVQAWVEANSEAEILNRQA